MSDGNPRTKVTKKRRRHGPKRGSEVFRVRTDRYVWRKPCVDHGAWRVRRRDLVSGKLSMVTLEATTPTEAKDEVRRLAEADKVERTNPQPREGKLLAEALDQWLGTIRSTLSAATVYEYESELNTFKKAFGKDRLVTEIDYDLVEQVFTETWVKAKGRTILKKYGRLQTIWRWLLRKRYAITDPISMYEPAHRHRQENRKAKRTSGRRFQVEECRRLIAAAAEPTKTAIVISLLTGLRLSNVCGTYRPKKIGLTWGDIDMKGKVLRIPGERMKNHDDFVQPVSDQLHAFLKARLRELGRVPAPEEQVVTPHDHKLRWKAAVEKAQIVGAARWHDMRHHFGATIGGKGGSDAITGVLLGHSKTGSVTSGYSWHQLMEDLRERINTALPLLIGPNGQPVPGADLTDQKAGTIISAV